MDKCSNSQLHIPEILAPAGTKDAMKAAVNAGCDAVYLGGDLFSARAFAGNFDQSTLLHTIDYCHFFGVRVYMTVNTLLKETEIRELAAYMKPYYLAGLDGVIVQDTGVAHVLKQEYPKLHLHGSTQMSISSVYGAKLLKNYGFTRVVPARELSLWELREIRSQVDIEIETFVHGAMCYAYSGKCLFSSFAGGRSGNRGRCAQPCRQYYEVLQQGQGKDRHAEERKDRNVMLRNNRDMISQNSQSEVPRYPFGSYIMSMKDLCTLEILPELIDAGIDSFKIEGRMKNPAYVAATVAAYRKARDAYLEICRKNAGCMGTNTESGNAMEGYHTLARMLTEEMQDIYNRGGFHTGYYKTEKGREMIAEDRPNHTGLLIGQIHSVKGGKIRITLSRAMHRQDVLEIRPAGTELTSNQEGEAGQTISLNGKELKKIRPGMQVYRTRNNALLQQVEHDIILPEKKVKAAGTVIARIGEPLRVRISSLTERTEPGDGKQRESSTTEQFPKITIEATGAVIEAASKAPAGSSQLIQKLQKTGGTHIDLEVSCELDENAFVPMSEFNQLRRQAMDNFRKQVVEMYRRKDPQNPDGEE